MSPNAEKDRFENRFGISIVSGGFSARSISIASTQFLSETSRPQFPGPSVLERLLRV